MIFRQIRYSALSIAISAFVVTACGGSTSQPPTPPFVVNGTEQFGWDQSTAISGGDINQYQFVAYLDDGAVGQPLPDATCRPAVDAAAFQCDARLPPMAAGERRLSVAAAILSNGDRLESSKSAPLNLLVVPGQSLCRFGRIQSASDHDHYGRRGVVDC